MSEVSCSFTLDMGYICRSLFRCLITKAPVHCIIQLVMTVVNMNVVSSLLLAQQAYILEMNQIVAQYTIGLM